MRKGGRQVAEVGPGAILGEMSLFNENVRTNEVTALEPCVLVAVSAPFFNHLVLLQEPAAVKMMEALGRLMVQRLQDWDADLLHRAGGADPRLTAATERVTTLRKRLLADWR